MLMSACPVPSTTVALFEYSEFQFEGAVHRRGPFLISQSEYAWMAMVVAKDSELLLICVSCSCLPFLNLCPLSRMEFFFC